MLFKYQCALAFLVDQVVDALLHHLRARDFHRGDIEHGGDNDLYRHAEQQAMERRGHGVGNGASRQRREHERQQVLEQLQETIVYYLSRKILPRHGPHGDENGICRDHGYDALAGEDEDYRYLQHYLRYVNPHEDV